MSAYLTEQILLYGEDFIAYQNYYMENYRNIDIPYAFSESDSAKQNFEKLLKEEMEEGMYAEGWTPENLSPKTKEAWFIYIHEFWILVFERARKVFDLPYTYYLVPDEEHYNMVYMIDGERILNRKDGKNYILLGDIHYNDPKEYPVQWASWFTGKKQNDVQVWNNQWGYTYAYYTPLIINGQKLGLVAAEVDVSSVNHSIVMTGFWQFLILALGFAVGVIVLLSVVYKRFILKIVKLEANVRKYSITKDYRIAGKIEEEAKGKNEISSLAKRISEMILELENYMRNVFSEKQDSSFEAVRETDVLRRDALTGIRAGASFENELIKLETERTDGLKDFGFIYADLNDLGKMNSSYGIDQGNVAIKKLCSIVCKVFEHSPVFRVGGDDFVGILYNDDYKNVKELIEKFNECLIQTDEAIEPWDDISAAIGVALYDPALDGNAESVLNRAELNMQNCKKEMKSRRKL
ncbi:MAG: GGDEF domain-containing protein [Treponema sp.]|nr:GGDEF domain-containing protein [Treponema sp.]